MATISRKFTDISLSFVRNPVTNDILTITNEDAIKKAISNLIRTRIGERFFNNLLGTSIDDSMFELQTPEVANSLETEIKTLLKNYEPRIGVPTVLITYPEESNEMYIEVAFDILGLPFPRQTISLILQPTRV
jgi:phage baseplate assembly protein W